MADADLQITFGADASGVEKGAASAVSSMQTLKPAVADTHETVKALGSALAEAFKSPNLDGVKSAASELGATLVTTGGLYGALAGAAMLAGVAAVNLAEHIAESGRQTQEVAQKFGVGVTQAQSFQAIAALLGVSIDEVARKAASGAGEFDQYNQMLDAYGVRNADAVEKAGQLAAASNETKVAMAGFGNVLSEALAPTLTVIVQGFNSWIKAMGDSYRQGGVVKMIIDGLVSVFKGLVIAVVEVGAQIDFVFATIDGAAWMLAGVIEAVVDVVIGYLRLVLDNFKTFGDVVRDALTLNWGAIGGDIVNGLKRFAADVVKTATQMGRDAGAGFKKGADEWAGSDKTEASAAQFSKALWRGAPHRQTNTVDGAERAGSPGKAGGAGGAGSGGQPAITAPEASGRGARSGGRAAIATPEDYDAVKQLQDALTDLKETHNSSVQNMGAVELAFWQNALAHAKDLKLTEGQVTQITATVRNLAHTQAMQALQEEGEAAKRSAQEQVAAVTQALAEKKKALDQAMKAAEDAAKRGEISRQAEHARLDQLIDDEVRAEQDAASRIASIKMRADAVIMATNDNTTSAYKNALQDWIAAAAAAQAAITKATQDGAAKRRQINQQDADQFKADWDKVVNPVVSTFTSGVVGMLEGTKTFSQVWRGMAQDMLNTWVKSVESMIERWLWKEAGQTAATLLGVHARTAATAGGAAADTAATGTAALADIGTSAAKAAAATFAAVVQAFGPLGPFIAPALAAGALAAVLDFRGLVKSAAGGFDIPSGLNPVTQLHAEEMVLPARIANPLRNMIAANDAGANDSGGFGAGRGGDTHHWHVSAIDAKGVQQFFDTHGDKLMRTLNGRLRNSAKLVTA
jgi:hypothetical protein